MTTASEIIIDALNDINAYSPGQPLQPQNSAVALRKLNDLLDSLSTDKDYVYTTTENILSPGWNPGQYKYSVGNYEAGTFSGTLVSGSAVISGVTVPTNLVVGGTITDIQNAVPSGTTVLTTGTNTVTLSASALFTVASAELFTYTIPGDISIARPLRINNSYTRILGSANTQGLDYWFDIISMDRYNELGYKGVPGPWPTIAAYQPTFPLGTLWVYPSPTISGEVHLFTDLIFEEFTNINESIDLPQGYTRSLKKLLALELCPSYGKTPSPLLLKQAGEARTFLKSLNAEPVVTLRYDSDIVRSQQHDAGWIVHGGFV